MASKNTDIHDRPRTDWEVPGQRIADKTNSKPIAGWRRRRINTVVIHYPGGNSGGPDTAKALRNSNSWYQRSRGYSYGYNWVIDTQGVCWQVRGFEFTNGANTPKNNVSVSIQLKVDGQAPATPVQVERANRLIADIEKVLGRKVKIIGHGEVRATRCPGDGIGDQLARGLFKADAGDTVTLEATPAERPPAEVPPLTLSVSVTRNSRGNDARWVQRALTQAGFDPGPIDGYYGPRSAAAARRYQAANGHTADGWVGRRTYATLRKHAVAWAEANR